MTRPRMYQGRALDGSRVAAAIVLALALAFGIFVSTLLPYLKG